jgi:hypothetical protein
MRNASAFRSIIGWISFLTLFIGLAGIPFGLGMEPLVAGMTFLVCDAIVLLISGVLAIGWGILTVLLKIEQHLEKI